MLSCDRGMKRTIYYRRQTKVLFSGSVYCVFVEPLSTGARCVYRSYNPSFAVAAQL